MSQSFARRRLEDVNVPIEALEPDGADATDQAKPNLEALFAAHYAGVARVIARLVRDYGRAEELAVDVFVKAWRGTIPCGTGQAEAWLYRAAIRKGLDELRRQSRRDRLGRLLPWFGGTPPQQPATPEQLHATEREQARVRTVLARIKAAQAELLVLRAEGLSYQELAEALRMNPASVGTQLARAQQAFRKEYEKRYGTDQQ